MDRTLRRFHVALSLSGAIALGTTALTGAAVAAPLRSQLYVGGFTQPVAFVQDPSNPNLQYVVEQIGRIRVIQNGVLIGTPFLNLTSSIVSGGERGLLGLAFAPDYGTSRRFFVYFTRSGDPSGLAHVVVARFKRSAGNPLVADPSSRFDLVWSTGLNYMYHPYSNHNGGNIAFGPDGYLYIGTGDGGSGGDPENRAQSGNELLGKMLRIDVDVPDSHPEGFDIPPDNPFLDNLPIPARPEIWAFGLRNPWRWSFDNPAHGGTGGLIIADVGQSAWEEIDYEPPNRGGRNYGWRVREGAHIFTGGTPAYTPLTDPIFELGRSLAQSITGGIIYRGSLLGAEHVGRYFFANFYGRVYSIDLAFDGSGEATASDFTEHTSELAPVGQISSFGVDSRGELYIVNWAEGEIRRVLPRAAPLRASTLSPSGIIGTPMPTYRWNPVAGSDWYYLWVTDRNGVRIQQWYTASQAGCPGGAGTCSATPATAVAATGTVYWWVETWNPFGYGPWSTTRTFTPSVPGSVTLISPDGDVETATPPFRWNASQLASWYYLWVNNGNTPVIQQWYPAATVGCAGGAGQCSIVSGVPLTAGAKTWWIQTYNDVGHGPWSTGMPFTVTAATLVSPTGNIGTTTPTYTWNAVQTATDYYLWVTDSSGTPPIQTWYTAAEVGCAGGTGQCSITPSTALALGSATWWIQTRSEAGYGPWSAGMEFVVQ